MKIGQSICQIRKDNNLSQDQFAELFHVTRQTVSNWENEKSYPDLETIINISDQFHISVDNLLKNNEKMVKKIDNEKKKKRILFIALLVVMSISILTVFLIYYQAVESSKIAFDMNRNQTYQIEERTKNSINVQTGYFTIPKSGKVSIETTGSIDDGELWIAVTRDIDEKTCYKIDGQDINDTHTIYLEKGSYTIQVVANEYTEKIVSLSYHIHVGN